MPQTAGAPRSSWADDWEPSPPHPRPAATARPVAAGATADEIAREAARTTAAPPLPGRRDLRAGVLLAAAAVATATVAVLLAALVFLSASGGEALRLAQGAQWLFAAAFGLAAAATLARLANSHRLTLALAALAPAAAWLSGRPLPALVAATLLTGLAVARDRTRPPRPRPTARTTAALALAATACLVASLAGAHTHAGAAAPRSATPRRTGVTPAHAATPAPAARRSQPAPRRAVAPAAAPLLAPAAAATPAGLVAAYYAALDARRFRAAWAVLAPGVRREFGGFGRWRAGYATTLSSRPRQLRVTSDGPGAWRIRAVLVARDRTSCAVRLERRFAVRWRLARAASAWSVTALSATALTTGTACS